MISSAIEERDEIACVDGVSFSIVREIRVVGPGRIVWKYNGNKKTIIVGDQLSDGHSWNCSMVVISMKREDIRFLAFWQT
jgi:hypothetical protein